MSGEMPSNPHTDKVLAVRRALLCLWGGYIFVRVAEETVLQTDPCGRHTGASDLSPGYHREDERKALQVLRQTHLL